MLALFGLLAASSLAIAEMQGPTGNPYDILYSVRNAKYHLVCEFHGTRAPTKGYPYYSDRISELIVRNEQTGEAVSYNPPDPEGSPPDFANHDVWSPDSEWLVLSLGLHHGFQLIKASDALVELKRPQPREFLRLTAHKYKDGDGPYHIFLGWQSPASFYFNVTEDLHTTSTYCFNLEKFRLDPVFLGPGVAETYTTSKGKQTIHVDPMMTAPSRK